ncbi:MAG: NAD(P)H-hydrate dehydratase [Bacteroidetes bacterium]|nr:NAD(P)H-hydrate dehydratase [Bacteroidota bacterium]MBL6944029.1 NAD(P)H-hydrate dehydratase [Bacteroidales bacterium]
MKILSVDNIRNADAYTIINEPIASIDLMERAATQIFNWVQKNVSADKKIQIFTGLGNNGGDGLALGRMLANSGYLVIISIIRYSDNTTDDFQINYERLIGISNITINEINEQSEIDDIGSNDVIVDAIFGSGLSKPIVGFIGEVIRYINNAKAITISIDMPSGLFADNTSFEGKGEIIKADYTLSFQFPKLAFLLPENEMYVGNWEVVDIGLSHEYINTAETKNHFIIRDDIKPVLKGRAKFSHKGTYGHALLIAGSYGKMGAAILASRACLRSGVGLLHTHVPKAGIQILQTASPETMISIDRYDNYFSEVPDLGLYNAIGIGPGMGMEHESQMAMKLLIQNSMCPIVFDADAINILGENPTWLAFLPKGSILTPHPKEFQRIAGSWKNDFERLEKQKNLAQKHGIYIVLKGAYTSICFPDGQCYFNSTGNPGMATAGSGDVLTGIITGLLASGCTSGIASILGVYLHGLAGDIAADEKGLDALIASDIIDNLGSAFRKLHN